MPIPMAIARLNKRVTNRVLWPLVRRSSSFGKLVHLGRLSGNRYETPVNVFDIDCGFILALTYGAEVDWLKNVMAAGGCDIVRSGETTHYVEPRLVGGMEARAALPSLVRAILRLLRVTGFVRMDEAGPV